MRNKGRIKALKQGEGRTLPPVANRVKTLCFCDLAGNLGVSGFDPYLRPLSPISDPYLLDAKYPR